MKKSKILKWILLSTASLVVLFFIALVAHIVLVTPKKPDNATIQISRADSQKPFSKEESKKVHTALKSINGVLSDHINNETGVVVFFHDNRLVSSKEVVAKVNQLTALTITTFELSKEQATKKVCPAMAENTMAQRFTKTVQSIIQ